MPLQVARGRTASGGTPTTMLHCAYRDFVDRTAREDYVDQLLDAVAPALLVYARQCDRLGRWAPTPEDLARRIVSEWQAACRRPEG